MTNNYMIEFLNLDGCFQYETFLAEDQYEAIEIFKDNYPKCSPYNVFMELSNWRANYEDSEL